MDPEPLAGMLADDPFKQIMEPAGVCRRVARNLKWRMKFENVSLFLCRPYGEPRNDRRAGLGSDLGEGGIGAGRRAEEVDENAFFERSVLIDQHADRFVLMQRAQDGPRRVPFDDQMIAGELAALFHQAIDCRDYRAAGS